MDLIDSVKRFLVVLFTELILFLITTELLYLCYMRICTFAELGMVIIPLIIGIGGMGGGYIGIKLWENLKDCKEEPIKKEDKPNV